MDCPTDVQYAVLFSARVFPDDPTRFFHGSSWVRKRLERGTKAGTWDCIDRQNYVPVLIHCSLEGLSYETNADQVTGKRQRDGFVHVDSFFRSPSGRRGHFPGVFHRRPLKAQPRKKTITRIAFGLDFDRTLHSIMSPCNHVKAVPIKTVSFPPGEPGKRERVSVWKTRF